MEIIKEIRIILDNGFEEDVNGLLDKLVAFANVLDDIEVLLTENGYPTEPTEGTYVKS